MGPRGTVLTKHSAEHPRAEMPLVRASHRIMESFWFSKPSPVTELCGYFPEERPTPAPSSENVPFYTSAWLFLKTSLFLWFFPVRRGLFESVYLDPQFLGFHIKYK